MLSVVTEGNAGADVRSALDELVAEGARRMLAAALRPSLTRTSRGWPASATSGGAGGC